MLDLKKLTIAEDFEDGLKGKKVFDVVRCDKPQPNEWFKLFTLGKNGFSDFAKVVITEQEDARGEKQSYYNPQLLRSGFPHSTSDCGVQVPGSQEAERQPVTCLRLDS